MVLANPFSSITAAQLEEIVGRLRAELEPRAIYLFGSHALGVPRADSDVDILVLVDEAEPSIEQYQRGSEALRGSSLPVELHLCGKDKFERYADVFGSFQNDIRRKGVLLYAAED